MFLILVLESTLVGVTGCVIALFRPEVVTRWEWWALIAVAFLGVATGWLLTEWHLHHGPRP